MANQVLPRPVMHQRLVVPGATQRVAALAAEDVSCLAPPVEKQDCLLPSLKRALQEAAAQQDRSMGYLIEQAVKEYLGQHRPHSQPFEL